jgi:Tol biopolymer transport system component
MESHFRWRPVVAGLVLALTAAIGISSAVAANDPEKNGPITFTREDDDGFFQTWTARADMSHARQLTDLQASSGWSVWSPDGSRIAFDSDRADPDLNDEIVVNDVFTMKPNGRDVVRLTDSTGFSGDAAYSPDGRKIAFEADLGEYPALQGIYVMDAKDGRHKRRITAIPGDGYFDNGARFSPDGRWLVFTRFFTPPGEAERSDLYVVRLDGTGLRRITRHGMHPGDADWSPDGKMIVFEADLINGRGDSWLVRPDGTGLRNLTFRPAEPGHWDGFSDPVFSPDGRFVLLIHGLHFDDGLVTGGLATIRVDGTDLRYVGDGLGEEHQPDWGRAKGR